MFGSSRSAFGGNAKVVAAADDLDEFLKRKNPWYWGIDTRQVAKIVLQVWTDEGDCH